MSAATDTRNDIIVIVLLSVLVKFLSLLFVHLAVAGSLLNNLSTKWDSAIYVNITQSGYPAGSVSGNYAFAPGYPALIWVTNLIVGNYLLSAAVVSNVFSVLVVLIFYKVARVFFNSEGSLYASLALLFFPTFVTYGLVSYSEPVYLFFAIAAVYFFLRKRYFYVGAASSLAVLSGYASLLIPAIFIGIIFLRWALRKARHPGGAKGDPPAPSLKSKLALLWILAPVATFGLWMYYLDVRSGVLFSLVVAQAPWGTSVANPVAQFQAFFTGIFSTQGNPVAQLLERYPYTLSFAALVYPLWKLQKALAIYSASFMAFVLSLVGTAYMSGPRLMLSAWPVLLVFGRGKKEFIIPVLVVFFVLSLESTYMQMTSFWT
jgi:Dolichyl-phosphate-mannose-protein mannosyltransferase